MKIFKWLKKYLPIIIISATIITPTAQSKEKKIAVLFDTLNTDFWIAARASIKEKAAEHGYNVLEAISDRDDSKQYEQVKAMIARGVDGIIMVHTDANAAIPAIREANKANIPLVSFNRPPAKSDVKSIAVIADNYDISKKTAERMVDIARQRGGKYKAAILIGDLGDPNAIERRDGFEDAIKENTDIIDVVARIPTKWDSNKAYSGLQNAFQAHPDINFIFVSSDFLLPQAQQILLLNDLWHPLGHEKHVIMGSFDGDGGAYELLEKGYLDADGVQDVFWASNAAVEAIRKVNEGETVKARLIDQGHVVDITNLEQLREKMWGYHIYKEQQ